MVKTKQKKSLVTLIILAICIVSALALILTPIVFIDGYQGGTSGANTSLGGKILSIWGLLGIFGGTFSKYAVTFTIDFCWPAYITVIAFLVLGFVTYYIGPRKRGFYIFTAIVFVLLAVMSFTMSSTWLKSTTHATDYIKSLYYLGVGPWVSGILSCFGAIACIYEFKTVKLR